MSPMKPSDYDYDLPSERIAQRPVKPRDASRLLYLRTQFGGARSRAVDPGTKGFTTEHTLFQTLPEILRRGDLLVVNDTRVVPARLRGTKSATGGKIEVLLLEHLGSDRWIALARGLSRARAGTKLSFHRRPQEGGGPQSEERLAGEVMAHRAKGVVELALSGPDAREPMRLGEMPIPPYIRRGHADEKDVNDYQSLFGVHAGAVAAPTASLHFTPQILQRLDDRGVKRASVTLHVGWGTFASIEGVDLATHRLHAESYKIEPPDAAAITEARDEGRRVIAIGTTVARVLETITDARGRLTAGAGTTDLFIQPGHQFRCVEGLLTNFHLPRSSLLMMVCAFAGREPILNAYRDAVKHGYRFYSYGDAMLIL